MLLVEFWIQTVCTNDEWEDDIDSGEESISDGDFFTSSHYLVSKSLKDYEADKQKFEEMLLREVYNTSHTMKPHYFSPSYCPVHVSEDKWDWSSDKDFFLDRENCIDCNYPVLLKRGAESTLEIRVARINSIGSEEAEVLAKRIHTLVLTGYDNLSKSEVYTKYYNEEIKTS